MTATPPAADETAAPLAPALVRAGWAGSRRRPALPNRTASGSVTPFVGRRAFIGTLAGGLLAAPLAAEAQQATAKVPRTPTCERPFSKDCVTSVTSRAATS